MLCEVSFRKGRNRQRAEAGGVGRGSLGGTGGGVSGCPSLCRAGADGKEGISNVLKPRALGTGGASVKERRVRFSEPCVDGRKGACDIWSIASMDLACLVILGRLNESGLDWGSSVTGLAIVANGRWK
jgi:hypothetical protein